jgi:hypothetical protein
MASTVKVATKALAITLSDVLLLGGIGLIALFAIRFLVSNLPTLPKWPEFKWPDLSLWRDAFDQWFTKGDGGKQDDDLTKSQTFDQAKDANPSEAAEVQAAMQQFDVNSAQSAATYGDNFTGNEILDQVWAARLF